MYKDNFYTFTIYTRPLSVQAENSRSCPILCSSSYNGSLVTWTVVRLTAAKFKPLVFLPQKIELFIKYTAFPTTLYTCRLVPPSTHEDAPCLSNGGPTWQDPGGPRVPWRWIIIRQALGYDTMQSCSWVPTYRRNIMPLSSGKYGGSMIFQKLVPTHRALGVITQRTHNMDVPSRSVL
jgi:hypothetical protein